ncbi:hypothetical protein CI109_106190 [Kwoniella shandongensis]|uniref:RRM domain-containing protein n=1 Tax=Kwoniella shandongensis TaxID=1734106 RepID=A0AAJ8LLS8_9TREE
MSRRVYLGRLPPGVQQADVEDDAEDAIRDFNGRPLLGEKRRDTFEPPAAPRSRGVRISVIGIPSATSWQDLKDFGRIGGNNITYADVDRNNPNNGPPPRDFDDRRAPRDYERRDYGRDDRYGGRDRSPARGGYDNAPRRDYDRRRDDDRYVPRDARDARDARDTPRDAPRDVRDARDASRDARDARDAPRDAPREDRNGDRNGY